MPSAAVIGTGHALPERIVSSAEVEELITRRSNGFVMPQGMIELISGVKERRYADAGVTSSDLAAAAGRAALEDADADPLSVDLLIFASASHDISEPATAAIVQDKIGCRGATFVDVKNACNSFLNGLDFASAVIATGRARRVLVTSGEMLSPTINWSVRNIADLQRKFAAFTLGDAGGAFLLEACDDETRGLLPGTFVSDGRHWRLSTVMYGGTLMRADNSRCYFECDSAELQNLALKFLPELLGALPSRVGWTAPDLAYVVPHQVSRGVVTELCAALGFPERRCLVILDRYGNTAAASIPLAVSLAAGRGLIRRSDKLLFICGAAGFTAGVLPVVW
jgi:3-oxoacyl-(acyl-carrier-protein) synthase III